MLVVLTFADVHSRSSLEARNQASVLKGRTDDDLESDSALAQRLLRLESLEHDGGEAAGVADESSDKTLDMFTLQTIDDSLSQSDRHLDVPVPSFVWHNTGQGTVIDDPFFGNVVAQSRVYQRVENGEIDGISTVCSTRSHGWSILSGLSASQVTRVGVISLPIDNAELARFQRCISVYRL